MKIIQISSFFHPSVGGVERQVEEIASHLHDLGHNVQVLTTDATHSPEGRMQRKDEVYRGFQVRRFRHILRLGSFFRFSPGLLWYLLRADYELIHIHNTHDAHLLGAIIIKAIRGKKLILTGHNPYIVNAEKRGEKLHAGVGFFEFILKTFFVRGIDGYIALLESEKREVLTGLKLKEGRIVVIPNGIQEIYYSEPENGEAFLETWQVKREKWDLIVGTASRINYVKGLQNLEMAVKKLSKVLFVFAGGDAGYLSTLKKIYAQSDNVLLTERYLSSEEVKSFYGALDVFLLPSIYEPFGMTVVEAMAQGKVVISSNAGGPVEILNDSYGRLLPPTDQEGWLEVIKYFSKNKEELTSMGEAAKKAADRYQWKNVISDIEDFYKTILG